MATNQSRDLKKLNKVVNCLAELALEEVRRKGVNPLVVETLRSKDRQKYLYAQGRTPAQCKAAGVPVTYARSGNIVTQTLNSIHLTGCALDVVPQRSVKGGMTAIWNTADKDTKTLIKVMERYGFEAGAHWTSFKDSPHYQMCIKKSSTVVSAKNTTTGLTKAIQRALHITVDGSWGAKTTAAVKEWQRKSKLIPNGKLGVICLKKLLG